MVSLPSSSKSPASASGIVLARETQIFSMDAVGKARATAAKRDPSSKVVGYYEDLLDSGSTRFCSRPSQAGCLDSLVEDCPNFAEVIADLRRMASMTLRGNSGLKVMPLLLLGDPGVGKTRFGKRLAQVLGNPFEFTSMNTQTAGFLLTGGSASWKDSKPGVVSEALVRGSDANPLMLVDELDKASGDRQSDPMACLYQLLEPETATHFKDEFGGVEFDASNIVWVFTANDAQCIPEPLLSRMAVYSIPKPTTSQACDIAQRMYSGIRAELGVDYFDAILIEAVAAKLSGVSPRLVRRSLIEAMGKAEEAGRCHITEADLTPKGDGKRSIGFH